MSKRIALFPGSFDPITVGHEHLVLRGLTLFDEIVIGIGENVKKQRLFTLEQRMSFIQATFKDYPQVSVVAYEGLTIDFCKNQNITFILRGIRNSGDLEFESIIDRTNKKLYSNIESYYLLSAPEFTYINSSMVRELINYNADISTFIPSAIHEFFSKNKK